MFRMKWKPILQKILFPGGARMKCSGSNINYPALSHWRGQCLLQIKLKFLIPSDFILTVIYVIKYETEVFIREEIKIVIVKYT